MSKKNNGNEALADVYGGFAQVYDLFMADTPYDDWVDFAKKQWLDAGLSPELILDLGCGTGNITSRLAAKGYDMIGVDLSGEMLALAREKALAANQDILYLNQDMRSFELYGTVDVCLCLCDGLNYILEAEELAQVFRLVKNYLNPGGLFLFDLNTPFKYEQILGTGTFAEIGDDAAYIWENYYNEKEKINEYDLTFFVQEESGLYRRFEETHVQKVYEDEEIRKLIGNCGFKLLNKADFLRFGPVRKDSEKVLYVCEKLK